jgi:hypothetical protein
MKFFKRLFSRHKHEFSNWQFVKAMYNDIGQVKYVQMRACKTCKFVEIHIQEK